MAATVVAATPLAIRGYLAARGVSLPHAESAASYAFDDVVSLWMQAQDATKDRRIGVHVAERVPFGAFGAVEHLMVTSATLDAALHRLLRFYALVNQGHHLDLCTSRRNAAIVVMRRDGSPTLPCYADFVLVSVRRRMEVAVGGPFPSALGDARLAFDRELAATVLPGADEQLCRIIEEIAEDRLAGRSVSVADSIRAAVQDELSSGTLELSRICRRLGMSARTLQRRLLESGTSFRDLLDDARRERALRLLSRGQPLKAVADATGFAEVRSFHRAFLRWTGGTPQQWRRTMMAREAKPLARSDSH